MWEAVAYKAGILARLGRYWEARSLYERAAELGASGPAFDQARESVESELRGRQQSEDVAD